MRSFFLYLILVLLFPHVVSIFEFEKLSLIVLPEQVGQYTDEDIMVDLAQAISNAAT